MSFTTGGGVALEALSEGEATVTFTAGSARAVAPIMAVKNLWVLPGEDYESDGLTVRFDRASGRVSAHFEPMALQDGYVRLNSDTATGDGTAVRFSLESPAAVAMTCRFSFNRQGADYAFTPVLFKV